VDPTPQYTPHIVSGLATNRSEPLRCTIWASHRNQVLDV
jgi:hypothetical protein